MALLIIAGEEMLKVQMTLPKPPARITEEVLWQLRAIYDVLIDRSPDAAPYVAVVAMNRLQRPCEALRLPLMISRQTGDALISKTDMGLVGEIIFGRMDTLQTAILATRTGAFDADMLLAQVEGFSELSSSVVKEMEMRRDGEWGQRLLRDRAAVGNVMDAFMERAVKEISAALPHPEGRQRCHQACRARKTRQCPQLCPPGRRRAKIRRARHPLPPSIRPCPREISHHLRRYVEDAVRELKGEGERRTAAEFQLNYCAELAGLLSGRKRRNSSAVGYGPRNQRRLSFPPPPFATLPWYATSIAIAMDLARHGVATGTSPPGASRRRGGRSRPSLGELIDPVMERTSEVTAPERRMNDALRHRKFS